ncbi:MAG TPA: permease [Synergistaceae bacterium]|nr:permease [Synergistaceae bacterium]HQK25927.1 permease [Synergistaceae bacterium]
MNKKPSFLQIWGAPLATVGGTLLLALWSPETGRHIWALERENLLSLLQFIPPIFVLIGLFDAWVPREQVVAHLGEHSGLRGTALALALGSLAAGPLYAAFPVATLMLQKGAGRFPVFVFVGAWSTLKLPMVLFEVQSLGMSFALTRYALSLGGVLAIALILERLSRRISPPLSENSLLPPPSSR